MPTVTVTTIEADISRELRRSVLRPHLPVGAAMPGDDLSEAVHLGAFVVAERALASTCLISPQPCEWQPARLAWRLRSMATDPEFRGLGAGRAILHEARRLARSNGADILWCQARENAIGFYRRDGWSEIGELFDTDLGPHLRMWVELAD